MVYGKFIPLSPPRPDLAILPEDIPRYEEKGWVAQYKKNGQYSVVYVGPRGEDIRVLNRRQKRHKNYGLTDEARAAFYRLRGPGWRVFAAELLHGKVPGIRDVHYIHDLLVFDGVHLARRTFENRHDMLLGAIQIPTGAECTDSHWVINDRIWLARNVYRDFDQAFHSIRNPKLDEGLVFKNPLGVLGLGTKWDMVKCRHPHENYTS